MEMMTDSIETDNSLQSSTHWKKKMCVDLALLSDQLDSKPCKRVLPMKRAALVTHLLEYDDSKKIPRVVHLSHDVAELKHKLASMKSEPLTPYRCLAPLTTHPAANNFLASYANARKKNADAPSWKQTPNPYMYPKIAKDMTTREDISPYDDHTPVKNSHVNESTVREVTSADVKSSAPPPLICMQTGAAVYTTFADRNPEENLNDLSHLPIDPRDWTRHQVGEWLASLRFQHHLRLAIPDRFPMNGKGISVLTLYMFLDRVPDGGQILFHDFSQRLAKAMVAGHVTSQGNGGRTCHVTRQWWQDMARHKAMVAGHGTSQCLGFES